jgi:hypothetical protein
MAKRILMKKFNLTFIQKIVSLEHDMNYFHSYSGSVKAWIKDDFKGVE